MEIATRDSQSARAQWGETVARALNGGATIIEQSGQPSVAVVSYQQWQEIQRDAQIYRGWLEAKDVLQAMKDDPSRLVTDEELTRQLQTEYGDHVAR